MDAPKKTPELELADAMAELAKVNQLTAEDLKAIAEEREAFRQMDAMRTYYASERGC